jgi:Asp-tRNA(Asn)/Glu-tRNA(Gln) amidotransferase A subunit family amidase
MANEGAKAAASRWRLCPTHAQQTVDALTDANLIALTASEAQAAIARGDLASEALVTAALGRIAELEPQLNAWTFLDRDRALAQAKAADEQRREGKGVGVLHGVPVGIKDIIDTADMPTENGSAFFKGRQPRQDATAVAALRAAGAVVLGKTVTTELATLTPSVTRNPCNPEHTPGGSSSGSAAAVASGMVPVALGTQTGGSVIRPAAFCGVYGFKPTFGLIARPGVLMQAPSLDTIGVFGRSLADVALVVDAIQGYDERDPASIASSRPNLLARAKEDWPLPPMFTFVKTHAWGEADAVTREAFGELIEHLGDKVEEISIDFTSERGIAAAKIVQNVELAHHYGPLLEEAPDLISKRLANQIEEGRRVRGVDYFAALATRQELYATIDGLITQHGHILTPAALGPAPKGLESTGNPVFCSFWTYLGVPAVTLPLLEADGLPMGVQLIGARRDDGRLLRSARWLVEHLAEDA